MLNRLSSTDPAHPAGDAAPAAASLLSRLVGSRLLFAALCLMVLLVATGLLYWRASLARPEMADSPLAVSTVTASYQPDYAVRQRFAGRIEAARENLFAFERGGRVTQVAVDEGDRFKAGDLIARLDTRDLLASQSQLQAARAAAQSRLDLASLTLQRRDALKQRGFVTGQSLDEARLSQAQLTADVAAIDAQLRGIAIDLDKTVLRAPYAGTVASRAVDEGAFVGAGTPVVELLEDQPPRIRVGLSSDQAERLTPGGEYAVEINGRTVPVRLNAVRPDVDPQTRTSVALFDLPAGAPARYGDSADLLIEARREGRGFWLPLTALREGEKGLWSVYTVVPPGTGQQTTESDKTNVRYSLVGQEAVEVLYSSADRVFVRGTVGQGASIVAEGTHRLAPGMQVMPQPFVRDSE